MYPGLAVVYSGPQSGSVGTVSIELNGVFESGTGSKSQYSISRAITFHPHSGPGILTLFPVNGPVPLEKVRQPLLSDKTTVEKPLTPMVK